MTGSLLQSARGALAASLLLAPMLCVAESGFGSNAATARVRITVVVLPVFRVLQVTPAAKGYDYRVWTNLKSIVLDGREYRFERVGENTLRVPAAPGDTWVVHGL
jgi:formylmethanofuran:tetrahydromethanopterin formyltransferase